MADIANKIINDTFEYYAETDLKNFYKLTTELKYVNDNNINKNLIVDVPLKDFALSIGLNIGEVSEKINNQGYYKIENSPSTLMSPKIRLVYYKELFQELLEIINKLMEEEKSSQEEIVKVELLESMEGVNEQMKSNIEQIKQKEDQEDIKNEEIKQIQEHDQEEIKNKKMETMNHVKLPSNKAFRWIYIPLALCIIVLNILIHNFINIELYNTQLYITINLLSGLFFLGIYFKVYNIEKFSIKSLWIDIYYFLLVFLAFSNYFIKNQGLTISTGIIWVIAITFSHLDLSQNISYLQKAWKLIFTLFVALWITGYSFIELGTWSWFNYNYAQEILVKFNILNWALNFRTLVTIV
ncbi:MAG: hypothetical protein WAT21_13920, partial [Saprospiraceae bacterium]